MIHRLQDDIKGKDFTIKTLNSTIVGLKIESLAREDENESDKSFNNTDLQFTNSYYTISNESKSILEEMEEVKTVHRNKESCPIDYQQNSSSLLPNEKQIENKGKVNEKQIQVTINTEHEEQSIPQEKKTDRSTEN